VTFAKYVLLSPDRQWDEHPIFQELHIRHWVIRLAWDIGAMAVFLCLPVT